MGCVVSSKYTPPRNRNRSRHVERLKDEYSNGGSSLKPIIRHNKNYSSKHSEVETKKRVVIVKTTTTSVDSAGEGDKIQGAAVGDIFDDKSEEEKKKMKIASYEVKVGEGEWPKWLVDNISEDVLATLIRKTADSYEKLGKVSTNTIYTRYIFIIKFYMNQCFKNQTEWN